MEKFRNIPTLKAVLALSAGILIGAVFDIPHLLILLILIALIVICAVKQKKYSNSGLDLLLIYSFLITFGIFRAGLDFYTLSENSIAHIPDTPEKNKYSIIGIINDIPDDDTNRVRFNLNVTGILSGNDTAQIEGEIVTTIYKNRYEPETLPGLKAGDKVLLTGRLATPRGRRNPGEFDYRHYLMLHNIYKTLTVSGYKNVILLSSDNGGFVNSHIIIPAKYFATEVIEKNMYGDEAGYLKGLITGQRNDISPETKDAFIKSGVMHLIAVSGLNVAYVLIIITTILGLFRIYFKQRTAIAITALVFYCIFTGSSPSIVRASIMGILLLVAYESELKTNFYNIVGFSAFVILIFNTKQLFDPGFILSYTAVLSMVFCYERFKPILIDRLDNYEWRYKRYLKYALILLVTTLAAQIGVLPVSGSYFEKISVISVVTNLVIVPIANLSLAIGFMQIITALLSEYLSSIIASANQTLLSFQLWFIKLCASLDYAYFEIYKFDTVNITLYFVALILFLTIDRKNLKFRLALVILVLLVFLLHNTDTEKNFRASFLDAGKGDCTVIQTPDEKTIVIDCGTKTAYYDSGERTIIPYLKRSGVKKIDLLILTGDEKTKTGGLEYIVNNFPVSKILTGNGHEFDYYQVQAIKEKNIGIDEVGQGDMIDQIKNFRIYFLKNTPQGALDIKVAYKDFGILLSSDPLSKGLQPVILTEGGVKHSKNGVISTSQNGAVIIETDGQNIQIIDY